MKLGFLNITRQLFADKKPKVNTVEIGGSGTTIFQGMISDVEYNPKLNTEYGQGGLDMFDKMRKSDPIVKQSLRIVTLPIIQAKWTLQEPENEPQAEEITAFIKEALFQRMGRSFKETIREVLTYLPMGFSVFEKVFVIEDDKVWIDKLAMRIQKSIVKFETKDHGLGVTQQLKSPKWEEVSIPEEKLMIFTNEQEGDNYRGVSILRSAYKPFYYKDLFEKIDAISFERQGVGIPKFTMPKNAKPSDVAKAEDIGKNLRANEKAHVILPYDWQMEITDMKGNSVVDATPKIQRLNREILSNVLAQFLDLGSGSSGSRALSDDHSEAFFKANQTHADNVAEIFNDKLIKQLVDLNFDNVKNYPKLMATGIKKVDLPSLSKALNELQQGKMLTVDVEMEEFVRDAFDLPSMSDDLKQQKEEELEAIKEFKKNNPLMDMTKNSNDNEDDGKGGSNPNEKKQGEEDTDKESEDEKLNKAVTPTRQTKEVTNYLKIFKECNSCGEHHFNDNQEFFRDLTFAEQKIDFPRLRNTLDDLEIEFSDDLLEVIETELSQLLIRVRIALRNDDAIKLEALFSQFRFEIDELLRSQTNQALELGKRTASTSMKVKLTPTPLKTQELINAKTNAISSKMSNDLVNQVKLQALEHLKLKTPPSEAVLSIRSNSQKLINRQIKATSSNTLMGGFNGGREIVFDENADKIYALQRSELLDRKICNYCLSVDGRTVLPSDPMAKQAQFHFHCRGIWVEILVDEEEKPEISGIPNNLRDKVGSITDFKQIKKPQPLQDSLAETHAKQTRRV